eukprot:66515_1
MNTFEWKLSKHEVQSLIDNSQELKQNDEKCIGNCCFRSDEFVVSDTNFYLTCNMNNEWINLFLNLNRLPQNTNGIYARISFHCNEIGTHFSTVCNLSMIFNNIGWTKMNKSNDIILYLNDKSKQFYYNINKHFVSVKYGTCLYIVHKKGSIDEYSCKNSSKKK